MGKSRAYNAHLFAPKVCEGILIQELRSVFEKRRCPRLFCNVAKRNDTSALSVLWQRGRRRVDSGLTLDRRVEENRNFGYRTAVSAAAFEKREIKSVTFELGITNR